VTNVDLGNRRTPEKPRRSAPFEIGASAPFDDDIIDRLLGDHAFVRVREACKILRVSSPTIYRAMRKKIIAYVWHGSRRAITRAEMRRVMREGLGRLTELDT
jgi:excisionase family DNA binding protein